MSARAPRTIGVGVIGYEGVAKAHLHAVRRVAEVFWPARLRPALAAVCGRAADRVRDAARRYGADAAYTDWRVLVEDPRVELLINAGPNDVHAAPCLAAAARGIHLLCEKPLGRTTEEAAAMRDAAARADVVHMTGYNYRFIPAVLLARRLIEEGRLGTVRHFRARFCDDSMVDPAVPFGWRHSRARAGSGVIGDLAAHAVDLARFLVGEITAVSAATRIYLDRRRSAPQEQPGGAEETVDVEDAVEAVIEFEGGAVGTLSASTFCPGRKNFLAWEINGTDGSAAFNLERLNELEVFLGGDPVNGFRTVMVTEAHHPYGGAWWPPGHIIGWEHTFVHQLHRCLAAAAGDGPVAPDGATFDDGVRCAAVCEALDEAAREGRRRAVGAPAASEVP